MTEGFYYDMEKFVKDKLPDIKPETQLEKVKEEFNEFYNSKGDSSEFADLFMTLISYAITLKIPFKSLLDILYWKYRIVSNSEFVFDNGVYNRVK